MKFPTLFTAGNKARSVSLQGEVLFFISWRAVCSFWILQWLLDTLTATRERRREARSGDEGVRVDGLARDCTWEIGTQKETLPEAPEPALAMWRKWFGRGLGDIVEGGLVWAGGGGRDVGKCVAKLLGVLSLWLHLVFGGEARDRRGWKLES